MKKTKEARVSWNNPEKAWYIRIWSDTDQEWNVEGIYPVKDMDEKTYVGWVSDLIVCRFIDLQDLGYNIIFEK